MQINRIQSCDNNYKVNFNGTLKFTNLTKKAVTNITTSKELDRDLYDKAAKMIDATGSISYGQDLFTSHSIKNYAELLFKNLSTGITNGIELPNTLKMCHFNLNSGVGYWFKLPEQFEVVHYINK